MSDGVMLRWFSAIAGGNVELPGCNDISHGEMFQHFDLADDRVSAGSASEDTGGMES